MFSLCCRYFVSYALEKCCNQRHLLSILEVRLLIKNLPLSGCRTGPGPGSCGCWEGLLLCGYGPSVSTGVCWLGGDLATMTVDLPRPPRMDHHSWRSVAQWGG